ncbi:MAG: hypothetical protein LUF91_02015 [Oscillospiraceae bacterium]|nr:hypothetical protein [Oscillospiraceae bacterium]
MNGSLTKKNILVTLLRNKTGDHVSRFTSEIDFILELSSVAYESLSDEQILDMAESRLRRAADNVLHSKGVRERYAQSGVFTWDDFVSEATTSKLGVYGLHKFEYDEMVSRHIALAVDRQENLMPDLSDGHVYVCVGKKRRRLIATVNVDLKTGTMTGEFKEDINPEMNYMLAFKDHDELIPLVCTNPDAPTAQRALSVLQE